MSARCAVGRRDDAHVDFAALARAEHLEGAVLQHAQHLDLRRPDRGRRSRRGRSCRRRASSKRPLRSARASVKAPRTWPNISLSNSVDEMPPRFTLTNGAVARGGCCGGCASATSSLPVPLSPVISTDASVGATRPTSCSSAQQPRIAADAGRRSRSARPAPRASAACSSAAARDAARPSAVCTVSQHLRVGPRLGDEVRRRRPSCPRPPARSSPTP